MIKRNAKWWIKLDYKKSLDYYLGLLLEKYGYDPLEVIVWYYDKKNKIMLFQSKRKYYKLENDIIKEISEKDIWKKK